MISLSNIHKSSAKVLAAVAVCMLACAVSVPAVMAETLPKLGFGEKTRVVDSEITLESKLGEGSTVDVSSLATPSARSTVQIKEKEVEKPAVKPAAPAQDQPETPNNGGWKTGTASYYGLGDGLMGGTCADGSTLTETSMGVAMLGVPFGTKVEISFGGNTVIATVVDRGPYHPGRVMDVHPAVARALGIIDMGVATVSYRFV